MKISNSLQMVKKVESQIDNTVKFIFVSKGQVIEFSYINKGDGKDIICIPTQTSCNLKCKFCFLSDYDLCVRNLEPEEMLAGIIYTVESLSLVKNGANDVLLISFMGCGEPLLNLENVLNTCELTIEKYKNDYRVVRFGLASLIPAISLMKKLTNEVAKRKIPIKFHLSLHSTITKKRKELLPAASSINESIKHVCDFVSKTNNSAEIHYAMIDGENDGDEEVVGLTKLLKGKPISIKFLIYNEKPSTPWVPSGRVDIFRNSLEKEGIETEFYVPPGGDVGSSCGQFLMDYYLLYNKK